MSGCPPAAATGSSWSGGERIRTADFYDVANVASAASHGRDLGIRISDPHSEPPSCHPRAIRRPSEGLPRRSYAGDGGGEDLRPDSKRPGAHSGDDRGARRRGHVRRELHAQPRRGVAKLLLDHTRVGSCLGHEAGSDMPEPVEGDASVDARCGDERGERPRREGAPQRTALWTDAPLNRATPLTRADLPGHCLSS